MKTRMRTVHLHERIECPPLWIFVLSILIGPAERPRFKVSSVCELWVILDLGSPLTKKVTQEESMIEREGSWDTNPIHAIIISPGLATGSASQQVSFE